MPPTGKAGEIVARDRIPVDRPGERLPSLRGVERDLDVAFDAIVERDSSRPPLERLELIGERRDTVLTPGQERFFETSSEPMVPGSEIHDVLRTLYEFQATAGILEGYETEPVFIGLRWQLESVENLLVDFGPDLVVDAQWKDFYESAQNKMRDAADEILTTGELSFLTKMDLELALDDVRMATFRLGQETYGATPELAAAAAEAGANVLAGGLVLEFGHLFERIFLGD
jgi:hypothetical protein